MGINKVKQYFEKWDISNRVMTFEVSSATVELAAEAVGCEPKRIAKTLSFRVGESPILIVAAGDAKVDNIKYKTHFKTKAKMLSPDEVLSEIGYPVGGVCPFDINEQVAIYLDVSLKRFDTVFPACGSANSAIELNLEELWKYSNASEWVDVCKAWCEDANIV